MDSFVLIDVGILQSRQFRQSAMGVKAVFKSVLSRGENQASKLLTDSTTLDLYVSIKHQNY